MVTDDEPMLPQPSGDNAPMISGRGTKIIADARGAYIVGNLRALIGQMTEMQQLQLRQTIVRQLLMLSERVFNPLIESDWLTTSEAYYYVRALVEQWLVLPNTDAIIHGVIERQEALYDEADNFGGDWPLSLAIACARMITAPLIEVVASSSLTVGELAQFEQAPTTPTENFSVVKTARRAMYRWQLDAAWSILQGRQPPPFPEGIS